MAEPRAGLARRRVLAWLGSAVAVPAGAVGPGGAGGAGPVDLLRAGGVAVMLRHATTTSGIGDPPGFRSGDCTTQRNLSGEGREEARRIGAWFERHRLVPAAVRTSAWCRCIDTARLAFGREQPWPVLDSLFGQRAAVVERVRLDALDAALRGLPAGRFEVWVTHQVNITAATGEPVRMGEGVVVRSGGDGGSPRLPVLARLDFRA